MILPQAPSANVKEIVAWAKLLIVSLRQMERDIREALSKIVAVEDVNRNRVGTIILCQTGKIPSYAIPIDSGVQELDKIEYRKLYAVIGDTWTDTGVTPTEGKFILPNPGAAPSVGHSSNTLTWAIVWC